MSGNDTTWDNSNASSRKSPTPDFEKARNEQALKISQLPKEAQEKAALLQDVYDKRLASEQNKQQRSRAFRQLKAKERLLEDYVRSDQPRPDDPQAKANDLRLIDERAKELVHNKEAYYLDLIQSERHETLEQVIQQETEKQSQAEQQHAQGHELGVEQGSDNAPQQSAQPTTPEHDFEQER